MGKTTIEWTRGDDGSLGETRNPVTGCDKVSPGCDHCYAEGIARRFAGTPQFPDGFAVTLRPERLEQPLRWRKPRRVFVNSMSDLFHKEVPDEYIAQVFATMARAERHTFQVLTKRPARMRALLGGTGPKLFEATSDKETAAALCGVPWPLRNVWLGVSAETQETADLRIPRLLDTPAEVRFVSAEPLLGPIDLAQYLSPLEDPTACSDEEHCSPWVRYESLDWVIVGGESGPRARPMHPDWARSLRDQCTAAGVAFHYKQSGEWVGFHRPGDPWEWTEPTAYVRDSDGLVLDAQAAAEDGATFTAMWRVGKKAAGRELDGRTWDEFPEVL